MAKECIKCGPGHWVCGHTPDCGGGSGWDKLGTITVCVDIDVSTRLGKDGNCEVKLVQKKLSKEPELKPLAKPKLGS